MKSVVAVCLSLVLLVNISNAEETKMKDTYFGINPLGLIFGMYSGDFGFILDEGKNDLNISFFFWTPPAPLDDLSFVGGGIGYRWYMDGKGEGVFYGPRVDVLSVDWDYRSISGTSENITAILFTPGAELGYRWSWNNGFTLAPTVGVGYVIGELESKDGTVSSFSEDPIAYSVGIGLGWMW